ncbi:MAG: PepSY domain-containing protein [Burkholderiaceae bacterium]
MTPTTFPLALAAALALVGALSLAQTAPQRNAADVKAAPSSLAQAIRTAEQETGGRARKAEAGDEDGTPAYEIKTVTKDESAEVLVDAASGKVMRVDKPGFFEMIVGLFDRGDRREEQAALARLEVAPMTLAAAIDAAERETGGRAVKASMKDLYGQTLFKVGVLKDLSVHKFVVDPVSGKVSAVAPREGKDDD